MGEMQEKKETYANWDLNEKVNKGLNNRGTIFGSLTMMSSGAL